jgi:branched-chain amino acid transport system permease protein
MTTAETIKKERRLERLDRGVKVRCESVYGLATWRELAFLTLPHTLFIGVVLLLPLFLEPYWQRVFAMAGVYALLALSFDFLAQYVGLVCLGLSFFVGCGGYVAAILTNDFGFPPLLAIPVATVVGAAICTLVLYPCLRLRGIYFAIISLMIPVLAKNIIIALNIFGGSEGITSLPALPTMWHIDQYLILGIMICILFAVRRLVIEDVGLVFRAIKDNDQAVRASGINITTNKAKAVFIAAMIGCFAGAYLGYFYGVVGCSLFGLDYTILPIAATVMGGPGTLVGPVVGALILLPLSEFLRDFGQLRVVAYCVVLIGFMVFKPEGLMNYVTRKYEQFEHWKEV